MLQMKLQVILVLLSGSLGSQALFGQSPPDVVTVVSEQDPHRVPAATRAARSRFFDSSTDVLSSLDSIAVERDVHYYPVVLPELPLDQADSVVIGTVLDAACYFSTSHSAIYTEVKLNVKKVLKGNGVPTQPYLLMEGGSVISSNGPAREVGSGLGLPLEVGAEYLFFMNKFPGDDQAMRPLKAWRVVEQNVSPVFSRDVEAARINQSTIAGLPISRVVALLGTK